MKAIVANVLSGSIVCCFSFPRTVLANPQVSQARQFPIPTILPVKFLAYNQLPIFADSVNYFDLNILRRNMRTLHRFGHILTPITYTRECTSLDRLFLKRQQQLVNSPFYPKAQLTKAQLIFDDSLNLQTTFVKTESLSLEQQPYTHYDREGKVILGFQKTFWPSHNSEKYWGLTTVEHWGGRNTGSNLSSSDLTDASPSLPSGDSILTFSGGGDENLVDKTNQRLEQPPSSDGEVSSDSPGEFEKFRGGVAFHQGVSSDVTMGVGFVYEDLWVGFSQVTFKSDRIPLKTTVSLLTGESGLEIHSHLRFEPSQNFVLNYYNQQEQQKFDLNWKLIPGLSLIANGDSQQKSSTAGIKIDIRNNYFSLSAKAEFDHNQNWHWHLNSRLGPVQLVHASNHLESKSEFNYDLLKSGSKGWQFSLGVKYETRTLEDGPENLTMWGGKWHSAAKINNDYRWTFSLGYGYGSQGSGAIASAITTLQPNLQLKLTYQEISAVSNETDFKLELSSR